MKILFHTLGLSLLLFLPSGVSAEEESVVDDIMKSAEEGFSELERRMIKRYYQERHGRDIEDDDSYDDRGKKSQSKKHKGGKELPPGLAKKDRLPPGLARQLDENGALPPGLAKRDLPPDLEDRLGKAPRGYERTIVDNDVVLIEAATRKVVDIITNVVLE